MSASLMPNGKQQYFTALGQPLIGGKVYTYAAGTTTPKATYSDVAGTIPNTNPIILDSRGEALIYWSGNYKIDVQDSTGVSLTGYPVDNCASIDSQISTSITALITSLAASAGAALIGWIQTVAGAVIRTVSDKLTDQVSIFDFMTTAQIADVRAGTALVDVTTPMQAACNWLSTAGIFKRRLIFPAGTYKYSASPNWAIQHASIQAQGEVRLRYTGSGNAILLDAGVSPAKISNLNFGTEGDFIVEPTAAGTTVIGMYCRGIFRSRVNARIHGAGSAQAGFRAEGCILVVFGITVTSDDEGAWYNGSQPLLGISLSQSAAIHQTSYCTFLNANVQGCQIGIYLDSALGNVFLGGDSEFNTIYGLQLTTLALNNKFYGMDLEVNTTQDVVCAGSYNEFIVDTSSAGVTGGFRFVAGSVGNKLLGGVHDQVAIDGGTGNYIGGVVYGRNLSGNLSIVDNGTRSGFGMNWQAQSQKWTHGPESHTAITVTTPTFTYTNNTGMPVLAFVTGGTVSVMGYFRGASQLGTIPTNSVIPICSGDSLSITSSAAPTLIVATT